MVLTGCLRMSLQDCHSPEVYPEHVEGFSCSDKN